MSVAIGSRVGWRDSYYKPWSNGVGSPALSEPQALTRPVVNEVVDGVIYASVGPCVLGFGGDTERASRVLWSNRIREWSSSLPHLRFRAE